MVCMSSMLAFLPFLPNDRICRHTFAYDSFWFLEHLKFCLFRVVKIHFVQVFGQVFVSTFGPLLQQVLSPCAFTRRKKQKDEEK